MNFFWEFISILGGTVSLVGVAAFLAKLLAQHWLTKDLEDYKSSLGRDLETHKAQLARANSEALDRAKFEFEKELISRRGDVDLFRDQVKYINESEQQRQIRLHAQIQRWANPILGALDDLEHRLLSRYPYKIAATLRILRKVGITKVKVIGDTETLDVELGQDGRCKKAT